MRRPVSLNRYGLLLVLALPVALTMATLAQRVKSPPPVAPTALSFPSVPPAQQAAPPPVPPCEEPPSPVEPQVRAESPGRAGVRVASVPGSGNTAATSVPLYYLKLSQVKSVLVKDGFGHAVDPFRERPTGQKIEEVDFLYPSSKSVLIMTPTEREYTVTFQSRAGVVRLDLRRGVGNTAPDLAVRYKDLALPEAVTAMLRVSPDGIDKVRFDKDGDGAFETTAEPDVAVSGPAARDTRGPTLCIGEDRRGAKTVVTLAAADASGVEAIYYSPDARESGDMEFALYTGPFEVDAARTPVVWTVADDKLGNRSGLGEFRLKARE